MQDFFCRALQPTMQRGTHTWMSSGCRCPERCHPLDDHPYRRPPCGSGAEAARVDLTEMFQGAEYFSFGGGNVQ